MLFGFELPKSREKGKEVMVGGGPKGKGQRWRREGEEGTSACLLTSLGNGRASVGAGVPATF